MKPSAEAIQACQLECSAENIRKLAISCVESYRYQIGCYDYFNPTGNNSYNVCKMSYRGYFSTFRFSGADSDGTLCFMAKAVAEVEGDEYSPHDNDPFTQSLVDLVKTDIVKIMLRDLHSNLYKQLQPFCPPSDIKIKVDFRWKNRYVG